MTRYVFLTQKLFKKKTKKKNTASPKFYRYNSYTWSTFKSKSYVPLPQEGDGERVSELVRQAARHASMAQYSQALFDCVDQGHPDIARDLIQAGCDPDIWKQVKNISLANTRFGFGILSILYM